MGELLDRIEERMDQINADLEKKAEAEKNLSGMEKCCGICVLPWKKENIKSDKENAWMSKDDDKIVASHPQLVVNERECGGMGPSPQTGYMARITNDAREVELDDNLGQMNSLLSNMRNIALDMDSELDNQKERLDRINAKGDPNNIRKDGVTKPVNNLLKS
ncbi:synaptosomal-associated protein 25-like [Drosophila rhopaloa]|uniref:Synaptosomal-associated protein n=1 Tax=Drosophila rhopaloa TaxID=1041015 RepID=A0A6P4EB62_DRORH|nr:synaptosomal-associated protein 25-like [Drosophila rhopaloa]